MSGRREGSFWTTLPGILTATASLITAIAGALGILIAAGIIHPGGNQSSLPPTGSSGSPTAETSHRAFSGIAALSAFYSTCLLYTSPSPRDLSTSRMPSSA